MTDTAAGALFITGATGFLGGQVLARYLEKTERPVYALVRARSQADADQRLRATMAATYGAEDAYEGRVTAVNGDLCRPELGVESQRLDEIAEQVSDVVHAAASVSFAMPLDEARDINVTGTRHALELAERCEGRGGLNRFAYVSTTYVAGDYDGRFGEDDLDVGQTFRNSYEQSKYEAEAEVRSWAGGLPVRILRPGIVVGECQSGWTTSFNVLYYPIKLFAKGVNPPIVPARGDTPIDAVPIDYVADAIFALAGRPGPSGETVHLVAGPDASTIGHLLGTSARYFGRRPPLLIPLWLYMHTLRHVLERVYRGPRRRQLGRGAEFLPYFSMRQTFGDERARRALENEGLRAPPLPSYFERLLEFAVLTEWGRRPVSRDAARAAASDGGAASDGAPAEPHGGLVAGAPGSRE